MKKMMSLLLAVLMLASLTLSLASFAMASVAPAVDKNNYTQFVPFESSELDTPQKQDEPIANPFSDVSEGKYYYDAVLWAVNAEPPITIGTSGNLFSPYENCTRGQIITFLWRAAGAPQSQQTSLPFVDINPDHYYYNALLWAAEEGIASGTDATHFSPEMNCTRAQAVTFLWRSSGKPASEVGTAHFTDLNESSYYYDAVVWATEQGIINGISAERFGPSQTCTRAQFVTILHRANAKVIFAHCPHEYEKGASVLPTCGEPGWTEYTCSICGGIRKDDYTPSTNLHDYSSRIDVPRYLAHAATCLAPAEYFYSCTVCGGKGSSTFTVGEALGHQYQTTTVPPKSGAKGYDEHKCTRCGHTYRDNYTSKLAADQVGWNYRDGGWYYLFGDGHYANGTYNLNGYSYTFNRSGRMTSINEKDIRRLINAQPLRPCTTGIPALDAEAQKILQAATRPGDSNYDKLMSVYDYIVKNYSRPDGAVGILDYTDVLGARQMKYEDDLYAASFAYDFFRWKAGNCRHFSAGFRVLAIALGFETYTVGNQIGSSEHYWNNIRLGDKLYHFDTRVKNVFCFTDTDADKYGYVCRFREEDIARQGWFDEAAPFTVRVTFKSPYATEVNEHTWGTEPKMPSAVDGFEVSFYERMEQNIRVDPGPCEMTVELLSSECGEMTVKIWDDPKVTVRQTERFTAPISSEVYRGGYGCWVYVDLTEPTSGRTITLRIYC